LSRLFQKVCVSFANPWLIFKARILTGDSLSGRKVMAHGRSSAARCIPGQLPTWRDAVAELKKRTFDREKKKRARQINADFDKKKSGDRGKRDVVSGAKLRDEMDDELLNQVGTGGNAGDKRGAGNFYAPKN